MTRTDTAPTGTSAAGSGTPEIGFADFAHGAIELELLDRSQDERLLALEDIARALAQRGDVLAAAGEKPRERPVHGESDEARAEHGRAQQHERDRIRAARHHD